MNDGARRRGRGMYVAAAAGLAVLTAAVAGAVIALGSSSGHADAAPPTAAAPVTPTPSASAAGATTPSASAAPAAHRAAGTVRNGVHRGDLRFFLLPAPADADVYGDVDGSPLTADDIASTADDEAASKRALHTYGFSGGAYRTYLTADGGSEVTVRLARFGSPGQAAAYYSSHYYQGTKLALTGGYPARAYHLASGSAESTDTLLAISYQGDVHVTLTVTGSRTPSHALLQRLLDAQRRRLSTGR